jgi:DNA-binding NarL/FixJ family response regulator
MNRIRVVVAEDAALLREGVRSELQVAGEIEIAGEAETVDALTSLARELAPDVVLVDQDLPPGDTVAAIRAIKQSRPGTQIIVMADQLDHRKALEAIKAGATGYVLNDIPAASLAAAIRSVAGGNGVVQPGLGGRLATRLSRLIRRHGWARRKTSGLTGRELDVLSEVARGRTDEEIAAQFVVTPGTIKTHIRHILRKIAARNRAQAVAYVLRNGLIK